MPNQFFKILLADDDALSLEIVSNYLKESGYAVTTANNGREALQALQNADEKFDAVIVDRIMPYLHGIDLLKTMKQNKDLKNIPVIFLTGIADKDEIIEALKAGIDDLLYKPVEKELLLSVLKKVLAKKGH